MPKDEFDFDDPMELSGMALLTTEDTTGAMCECFVDEFIRMGSNPKQILALFRNPHYLGMNLVLQKRGESFVRDMIAEQFARRGREVVWPPVHPDGATKATAAWEDREANRRPQPFEIDQAFTDPMGVAIPKLKL